MAAKKPVVDPNQGLIDKYTAAGLTDVKNTYVKKVGNKVVFDTAAADKAVFEIPKITILNAKPDSFTQAVTNYSNTLSQAQQAGITNLNTKDQQALKDAAKIVRSFDSKNLSADAQNIISNITGGTDLIDQLNNKRQDIQTKQNLIQGLSPDGSRLPKGSKVDKAAETKSLSVLQSELQSLSNQINQGAPKLVESLSRYGLSDIGVNIAAVPKVKQLSTGLEALRGENFFDVSKSGLAGKLNVQVTDDQILNDINTQTKNQYKGLYDIGTAAVTDLQSQLTQANKFLSDLPANDSRRAETQKSVDSIASELAQAQKDTLEAKNLYEGYQPISGEKAASVLSQVRESLRLPEERTIAQIESIDPTIGATVRALSKQYQTMAETPLGPTTTKQTEDLRNQIEQEALNQLRLGSTLGAEERRGYEQAARSAQSARGNIFGLGPAVQEAANIGAAGEARKMARYGAATAFLGSGETTGAATARDLGLRNALEQSRLGAAQGFIASGPTMYNLASQRLGQQQNILNNYLAASAPQATGGFQATPSAANPYAYVNPNAGFVGAQNAASIYNTLADLQASQYGSQVGAIANSYRSPGQEFASIAGGISGFSGLFGSPGSSAFFRG